MADYLLFVWSPAGYELREQTGDLPSIGDRIEDGDRTLVIGKIGASPYPGDGRPCVFTVGP